MAESFPYPTMGTVKRPPGQGCLSCVHNIYCKAFYWLRRNVEDKPDRYHGIQCEQWSNDLDDRINSFQSPEDIAYRERMNREGLLIEPIQKPQENPEEGGAYNGAW